MKKSHKLLSALMVIAVMVMLVGCDNKEYRTSKPEAVALMEAASQQKSYKRMLTLADSLEKRGELNLGDSYFWQGYAYYRLSQRLTAEFYWKEAMIATEKATDDASLMTYAKAASYLTSQLCRSADYTGALKVAVPAAKRLEELDCDTSSHYANLIIFIGSCQSYYSTADSLIDVHFYRAYQKHRNSIFRSQTKTAYHNAIAGLINIPYCFILISNSRTSDTDLSRYERALTWVDRINELLDEYEQIFPDDTSYLERQRARCSIYRAITLEALGQHAQSAAIYREYKKTKFAKSFEGLTDAGDYLTIGGHWQEAAAVYWNLETHFINSQTEYTLENIQKYILKKYHANENAGYKEMANIVANNICHHLDSAIMKARWLNAEEQETIRQKETQIAEQQLRMSRARVLALVLSIIVLTVFFIVFTINRHRAAKRLAEVRGAKERMESELNIARNIQMSMVPTTVPDVKGLDIYASMAPAREVGGDLYSYLLKDDKLYFSIGDASGKGVPASLFMAQTTRLFHTLATQGMKPAEIATHMNAELAENNEQAMFVTMFLGLLDLKTGHLDFCNAGHNAPIIGDGEHDCDFLEMIPNAPIGLWPELEYEGEEIDSIKGRPFFIYTDGLNEAENSEQEQLGDDRMLKYVRATYFKSARQVIDTLTAVVEKHRNGADPNDDLTMMCIKLA